MICEVRILVEEFAIEVLLKGASRFEVLMVFDKMGANAAWVDDALACNADKDIVACVDDKSKVQQQRNLD